MTQGQMITRVCIPTLNAAESWDDLAAAIKRQTCTVDEVVIIDSQSSDSTAMLARASGFRVCSIRRSDFDHGGTRQMAVEMLPNADIVIYLTQDAILSSTEALSTLVAAFRDPSVAVAYGRQLPRSGAGAIEAHARLFNYPRQSAVRELRDKDQLGFKTIFVSDSFAAYRSSALMEVGGFPANTIFGEDTITAGRLLLAGYKIAYVAEAAVYHSHAHTRAQEFKRYFDIGVLHNREYWLLECFGGASGEGGRFVASELNYLLHQDALKIPDAILRTALKYAGYRFGRAENKLSLALKRRLGMNSKYWSTIR